jgi:hypothetical protein
MAATRNQYVPVFATIAIIGVRANLLVRGRRTTSLPFSSYSAGAPAARRRFHQLHHDGDLAFSADPRGVMHHAGEVAVTSPTRTSRGVALIDGSRVAG